ncbi:hypothetical protein NLJ89_g6293 [Agrocybe chaxingu]|uniref:Uncharacterized protein n=1 Tax=Agrocybe chaxingu TaxID=84603 RepID=A0A9W8MW59_9AGAR|nr:hypothetical protein NLJ89_g6293 [Agrocybe chaxingu]
MLTSFPSFTDAPPFYEPGAPRPTVPILLAQTELHAARAHVKLFAQEELGPIPRVQYPHDEDDLELDPDLTEEDDGTEDSDLIPKPPGEAGRPGRGGYALKEVLGWDERQYQAFAKYMTRLVNEHLDSSKCYSSQSLQTLTLVRQLAVDRYPALQNYVEAWPVTDALRLKLKYTSSRSRQQDLQAAAQIGKRITRQTAK